MDAMSFPDQFKNEQFDADLGYGYSPEACLNALSAHELFSLDRSTQEIFRKYFLAKFKLAPVELPIPPSGLDLMTHTDLCYSTPNGQKVKEETADGGMKTEEEFNTCDMIEDPMVGGDWVTETMSVPDLPPMEWTEPGAAEPMGMALDQFIDDMHPLPPMEQSILEPATSSSSNEFFELAFDWAYYEETDQKWTEDEGSTASTCVASSDSASTEAATPGDASVSSSGSIPIQLSLPILAELEELDLTGSDSEPLKNYFFTLANDIGNPIIIDDDGVEGNSDNPLQNFSDQGSSASAHRFAISQLAKAALELAEGADKGNCDLTILTFIRIFFDYTEDDSPLEMLRLAASDVQDLKPLGKISEIFVSIDRLLAY